MGCGCWGRPGCPSTQGLSQPHSRSAGRSRPRPWLAAAVPEQGAARQRRGWEPASAKWLLRVGCCSHSAALAPAQPPLPRQRLLLSRGQCSSPAGCRSVPTSCQPGAGHLLSSCLPGDLPSPFSSSSLLPWQDPKPLPQLALCPRLAPTQPQAGSSRSPEPLPRARSILATPLAWGRAHPGAWTAVRRSRRVISSQTSKSLH